MDRDLALLYCVAAAIIIILIGKQVSNKSKGKKKIKLKKKDSANILKLCSERHFQNLSPREKRKVLDAFDHILVALPL